MRTQVMSEFTIGTPWLEYELADGSPEKALLQSFPFTIGRNDSVDLQIDSNQVSREHAVITRHGKKYRVRDLGSTNGTFLNGEQIEEATLGDGDLLVIAEVELIFFCGTTNAARQTATQVMPAAQSSSPAEDRVWQTVLSVRKIHEIVTQRCLRTLFQPIIELATGAPYGYQAFVASGADDAGHARCEQWVGSLECRATERMRHLFRRVAVEESAGLPRGGRLFVGVSAAELSLPSLVDHLAPLQEALGETRQLVVEIPDSVVRSTPDFQSLLACLREANIQVAYDGYAASKTHLVEREDVAPDFLKLAPSLLRSIHRGVDRQRQVQLIVRACHDLGCLVVATGTDNEADLKVCRDLGCTLAQGGLFGHPQSLSSLIHACAFERECTSPRNKAPYVAAAKNQ